MDFEGHEVTMQDILGGGITRGGTADINSTKPAYRGEVRNRTGAVCWGHMGGPCVPGPGSALNL